MTKKKYNGKYDRLPTWKRLLHQNAGFIVMGISVVIIFYAWTLYDEDQEFYSSWSCSKLYGYMVTESNYGYPDHDDLTEAQHLKLHEIYANECTTDEEWQQELDDMKMKH